MKLAVTKDTARLGITALFVGAKVTGRSALCGALAALMSATLALAATSPLSAIRRFDISAQNLGEALNQFSLQSGQHILVLSALVQHRRAEAVRGDFREDEALNRLLAGSGLAFRIVDLGVILVTTAPPRLTPAPPHDPIHSDATEIAAVVVTALRRSTLAQDTPLSMAAFNRQSIEDLHIRSPSDLADLTPGLNFEQSGVAGQQRVSLRGVHSVGEATVGLYYDETPLTGPSGTTVDPGAMTPQFLLYDIGRIEVLKGPQGTLYGSGSLGGTVRVLFAKPDPRVFSGDVAMEGSQTSGGASGSDISAMVNLPVIEDRAALRVVAYSRDLGGYIDDPGHHLQNVNGQTDKGLRLSGGYFASDKLSLTATAMRQWSSSDSASFWARSAGADISQAGALTPYHGTLSLYGLTLKSTGHVAVTIDSSYYDWTLLRTIDASQSYLSQSTSAAACALYTQLTTSGACSVGQMAAFTAFARTWTPSLLLQPLTVKAWINEVRATSQNGPLTWTAGLYSENRRDQGSSRSVRVNPANGVAEIGGESLGLRTFENKLDQYAAFGEITYNVTARFALTAGARVYDYQKSGVGQVVQSNPIVGQVAGDAISRSVWDSGVSPKLMAAYHVGAALLYASVSQGFRPGGVNVIPGLPARQAIYHPDQLLSYETGVKQAWYDNRLQLNLAAYHTEWRNLQYSTTSLNGAYVFVTNVGAARIDGLDIDLAIRPIPALNLTASAAYVDARLVKAELLSTEVGGGAVGDRLPLTPAFSAAFTARYHHALSKSLNLTGIASLHYAGAETSEFDPANPYFQRIGGSWLADCGVSLERDRWTLSLRIDNLFDTNAPIRAAASAYSVPEAVSAPPRTISLGVRRSF